MAESIYQGVCAGIGDRESDINVIDPAFDATVRDFVIGHNGILDGFVLDDGKITKGACVAQGFVGYIEQDVDVPTGYKVYGKFEINHDRDVLDKFYVIVADGDFTQQDDILHGAGIFYLPLTEDTRLQYPINAYHADNASIVKSGGVASSSTNLEDGVTAVTQPADDESTKVATTKFVHDRINKDIKFRIEDFNGAAAKWSIFGTVYHKAGYCVIPTIHMQIFLQSSTTSNKISAGTVLATMPNGIFYPKEKVVLKGEPYAGRVMQIAITTAGEIIMDETYEDAYNRTLDFLNCGYFSNWSA